MSRLTFWKGSAAGTVQDTGRVGPCLFFQPRRSWHASGRRRGAAALAFFVCAASAAAGDTLIVARPDPESKMPVEIVRQQNSRDGKTLEVVFVAPRGIFRVNLDFRQARGLERLRFRIRDTKSWEGIDFSPADKPVRETVSLRSAPGVQVKADGADCVIEFNSEALKVLAPGGKFQFIDAYR